MLFLRKRKHSELFTSPKTTSLTTYSAFLDENKHFEWNQMKIMRRNSEEICRLEVRRGGPE